MAYIDLSLEELREYRPARVELEDFDAFWSDTLAQARALPLNPRFERVDYGLRTVDTFDVTFNGYGGHPIKGWFLVPHEHPAKLPCVVEYIGYGGGRGFPTNWLVYPSAGYATFVMDTRGQGSGMNTGDTTDPELAGNPQIPGFMTSGILAPESYYYRRVFTDAVRAVEAARSHPLVDAARVAVTGGSQGGGIALAAAGLVRNVRALMTDVPFLCHYRRATTLINTDPYGEIARYCKSHRDKIETVFQTLSYFDGVNFAARGNATALFSVGLMDDVCPPSTVFAAFNHYAGTKEIKVYEFNQHDGGGAHHLLEKIKFADACLNNGAAQ